MTDVYVTANSTILEVVYSPVQYTLDVVQSGTLLVDASVGSFSVPAGGNTNQVLAKSSNSSYDFTWTTIDVQQAIANTPKNRTVGVTIDGSGKAITPGNKGYVRVPFSGNISTVTVLSDRAGNITFDIWKTQANIPTVANSITSGNNVIINNLQYYSTNNVSSWNRTVTAGDVFSFNVITANTMTRTTLSITID